jgi:hypothetical protein
MAWYAYKGRRVTADDSRDPRFEVCDEGWRGTAGSLAACTPLPCAPSFSPPSSPCRQSALTCLRVLSGLSRLALHLACEEHRLRVMPHCVHLLACLPACLIAYLVTGGTLQAQPRRDPCGCYPAGYRGADTRHLESTPRRSQRPRACAYYLLLQYLPLPAPRQHCSHRGRQIACAGYPYHDLL